MATKTSRPPNETFELPDGTEVCYWDSIGVDLKPQQRRYTVGGQRCISMSTIAGQLDKPMLLPAGVKLQEAGIIELAQAGVNIAHETQQSLRQLLKDTGRHYDSIWGKARDRGDVAHDMMLKIVGEGAMIDLAQYPDDIRPWLQAGMRFVADHRPNAIDSEYMVGDIREGRLVAGRGDLYANVTLSTGQPGTARIDYKTVTKWHYKDAARTKLSPPYDENLIQLIGYETTARHCGYGPADELWIVRLGPDGNYDRTVVPYRPEVFECALRFHRERQALKKALP